MDQKLSLKDCSVKGKKALIRVDFNVPLDQEGRITDDTRITASLPTIRYVLDRGGSAILMSHLGRPKGKAVPEYSLRPVAKRLSELLRRDVLFAADCVGPETEKMAKGLLPGQALLLENLRFHKAEEDPGADPSFTRKLADLGEIYINDAFGTAHRTHASTVSITQYFPGKAAAGFLMEKEIDFLGKALADPRRPFHAIIGGAKISSKIGVLGALVQKVDALLIGGAMTYTFLKAEGIEVGSSLCEDSYLQEALEVLRAAKEKGVRLLLPVDHVIVEESSSVDIVRTVDGIPPKAKGVDIGPETVSIYLKSLKEARTILWNGPLGVFEDPRFAKGTGAIAAALPAFDAVTIVGGGDSIAALHSARVADKVSHLSTGGGASLEYIEFGTLPGIEALSNKLCEKV